MAPAKAVDKEASRLNGVVALREVNISQLKEGHKASPILRLVDTGVTHSDPIAAAVFERRRGRERVIGMKGFNTRGSSKRVGSDATAGLNVLGAHEKLEVDFVRRKTKRDGDARAGGVNVGRIVKGGGIWRLTSCSITQASRPGETLVLWKIGISFWNSWSVLVEYRFLSRDKVEI